MKRKSDRLGEFRISLRARWTVVVDQDRCRWTSGVWRPPDERFGGAGGECWLEWNRSWFGAEVGCWLECSTNFDCLLRSYVSFVDLEQKLGLYFFSSILRCFIVLIVSLDLYYSVLQILQVFNRVARWPAAWNWNGFLQGIFSAKLVWLPSAAL